ncbi:MAG: ABC transporter substrate-binding protein [Gemmatimonadales bacterium]
MSGLRLSAALLTLLASACGDRSDPIRIGLAGPFSQTRGVSMRRGAALAVEEVNRAGGVGGRPLELVVADDSADADAAVRVAQRLSETPGLVAVVGHLTSGTTMAAAPVYNAPDRPIVHISPSASSPRLRDAGPYSFRVCPSDRAHAASLAEFARTQLAAETAAVLYENDEYGRGLRSAFRDAFAQRGGVIVADEPYLSILPTFEPYLRRLDRATGADIIVVAGSATGAERVVATMDTVGIALPVIGADGLVGMTMPANARQRIFISAAYLAERPGPRNRAFVAAYRAAYREALPDHRGAGAYDAVHLLTQAMTEVGPDREAIRRYLADVGSERPGFPGVTGMIAFDANGDVTRRDVLIGILQGGRIVRAAGQ